MSAFNKSILTIKGNDLLISAVAGEEIEFIRLETGSGIYDGTENLPSMDSLKNKQQEFPFLRYEKISEDRILLIALVSNENLSVGYRMTELGVIGKLKSSDEEILCSIVTSVAGESDFWPPFNGVAPDRMILRYYISISPDAAPCITITDNMLLAEIAAEANRAHTAESALLDKILDLNNPEFIEAQDRNNIESGEKLDILFGKISKYFSDLNAIAFSGKYGDLSETPTKLSQFDNDSKFASRMSPVFEGKPAAPTPPENSNDTQIATTAFVKTLILNLVNGAPETLDTLKEIADALGENDNAVQALNAAIGNKVSKVAGKGLSANDYTNEEKDKLDGIDVGATQNAPSGTLPKANGTANAGTESDYARGDHVHPAQTSVSGNAGTASKWKNGRNVNGIIIDGSSDLANYGFCSTAADTAEKTVSCTGFGLVIGAEITVRFTVTNTAANPTLNVNGTGAKLIYYRGAAIIAGYLVANHTYIFRYNGTQYDLVGDVNTATTYDLATQSADGLMSADDKKKMDGIESKANKTEIANNYLVTVPGTAAADAVLAKELRDDVNALYGNLENFIKTSAYNIPSFTLQASSWTWKGIDPPKIAGYTPIGICGFDFGSGPISVTRVSLSGVWFYNIGAQRTIEGSVNILYIKS